MQCVGRRSTETKLSPTRWFRLPKTGTGANTLSVASARPGWRKPWAGSRGRSAGLAGFARSSVVREGVDVNAALGSLEQSTMGELNRVPRDVAGRALAARLAAGNRRSNPTAHE